MENKEIAQEIVRGNYINLDKNDSFHKESFIYKKTNEKLNEFFDILMNKDKVLTVIGSGDQILNTLLTNPTRVDAFDISVFPKYFLKLKIAAIKSLTREEYIKFFFATTETTLDEYYDDLFFDKIRKELDEETREFWEYLFNYNDWYDIYNSTLFSSEMVFETSALEQNKYLEKDEYYKLKEILKNININYIESDLMDLKIEDNYDLIYLSNIINYVKKSAYLEKIDEFSEKSKGIIVSYIFGELDRALKIFQGDFSYREFDSGSGIIINKGKQNIKK